MIEITKSHDSIVVVLNEVRPETAELKESVVALELTLGFHPELTLPINEECGLIDKVKDFYARFWIAKDGDEERSCNKACSESVQSTFSDIFVISQDDISKYKAALGLNASTNGAPVDFSTIVSWKPLIQSVFTTEVKGNLLNLVHLKHSYQLLKSAPANQLFQAGDEIVSVSRVSSLRIIDSGKVVSGVDLISKRSVNDQMVEYLEPLVSLRANSSSEASLTTSRPLSLLRTRLSRLLSVAIRCFGFLNPRRGSNLYLASLRSNWVMILNSSSRPRSSTRCRLLCVQFMLLVLFTAKAQVPTWKLPRCTSKARLRTTVL